VLEIIPTDTPFLFQSELPKNTYHKYCKNIYSQNGEDGILDQLLKELNILGGTFCEFGASDGITSSNTYNLIQNHEFSGIAIECDFHKYQKCCANYANFSNVQVFHGLVDYKNVMRNLDSWLKKGKMHPDFDILSIDIDSEDYFVWEDLNEFSPKIVIIETNPYRDPVFEELHAHPSREYNIDLLKSWQPERVACGSSFISILRLGISKGYIPVSYTGNLTFVRKDLIHNLKEFPYIISENPYDYLPLYTHLVMWQDKWYTNTGLILNVAIQDYYLEFSEKHIDISWINKRMREILNNQF
jgi:hypothetical protein